MDAALRQLQQAMASLEGHVLWLADEQVDAHALGAGVARPGLFAMTNRCDVAERLRARGIETALSDFDFSALPAPALDAVAFRVSKEKALVHHVLNGALEQLRPGGRLLLSGYKNEGIKTYVDKLAARAGTVPAISHHGPVLLATIQRGVELGEALDDRDYAVLREVPLDAQLTVWSKPGVFGWQKRDAGSDFLLDHLSGVWPIAPQRVLDLGCGYGYLSLLAARHWPAAEFIATDNNVAAVAACARNFKVMGVPGESVLSDAGAGIDATFDALLCNPPFHQGFEVDGALGEHFLRSAKARLLRRGRALFVVNQFINLETKATAWFKQVDIVARNKSFKLVAVSN